MDFKKTILWAVFSMSGLMLYSNWQVHEGKPSIFGGAPANSTAPADKSSTSNKADVPNQISGAPTVAATPAVNTGAIESAEKFILKNDVLVLEISANGANDRCKTTESVNRRKYAC